MDSGKRFAGTRALVTGAGSGIGAAVAGHLVAEGPHVTGVARTYSALGQVAHRLGDSFHPIAPDVADADDRRRAVEAAWGADGVLDVLVNNAAVFRCGGTSGDVDLLDEVLNINLLGVTHLTAAAIPALARSRRAAVVNVSSISGHVAQGGRSAYNTSKGALLR